MRVVSFKVDDDIYLALKKKKVSFRTIFEPMAITYVRDNRDKPYTGGIQQNSSSLYIYISQLQKIIDKIMESIK